MRGVVGGARWLGAVASNARRAKAKAVGLRDGLARWGLARCRPSEHSPKREAGQVGTPERTRMQSRRRDVVVMFTPAATRLCSHVAASAVHLEYAPAKAESEVDAQPPK
eukprot:scaffold4633_cov114-Isochrysis_galbana.AAC.12